MKPLPLLAALVLTAISCLDAVGAVPPAEQAQALVSRAEDLVRSGNARRAADLLSRQLPGDPPWPVPEAARLSFTLGWVHQEIARRDPRMRSASLQEAAGHYRRVLESYPGHPAASENLAAVLQDLGKPEEALWILQAVPAANQPVARQVSQALARGDLHRQLHQDDAAWADFAQAFRLDPSDDRAPWRMLELAPRLPEGAGRRLFDASLRFAAAGQPAAALRGCELVVLGALKTPPVPGPVSEAWELWLDLESQAGTFNLDRLGRLPGLESAPASVLDPRALREIRAALINPTSPPRLEYWSATPRRRHLLAAALQSVAQQQRAASRPREAADLLEAALRIAPEIHLYGMPELRDRPMLQLDLALEVATLYQAYPELDPRQARFTRLEQELLGGKNMAYAESNLPAMEKYHTVLGLIYAERGRWNEGNWQAAPYHLERAVRVARARSGRSEAEYQPHPQLTRVLAEGLATNSRPNLERSRAFYVDAAQGFLDRDDLRSAQGALDQAARISRQVSKPAPPRHAELSQVVALREQARRLERPDFAPGLEDPRRRLNWKPVEPGSDATPSLDPLFLQRQKVRVLDDLQTRAQQVGAQEAAARLADETLQVLQAAPGATSADLLRVLQATGTPLPEAVTVPVRTPAGGVAPGRPNEQILSEKQLQMLKVPATSARPPIRRGVNP